MYPPMIKFALTTPFYSGTRFYMDFAIDIAFPF